MNLPSRWQAAEVRVCSRGPCRRHRSSSRACVDRIAHEVEPVCIDHDLAVALEDGGAAAKAALDLGHDPAVASEAPIEAGVRVVAGERDCEVSVSRAGVLQNPTGDDKLAVRLDQERGRLGIAVRAEARHHLAPCPKLGKHPRF